MSSDYARFIVCIIGLFASSDKWSKLFFSSRNTYRWPTQTRCTLNKHNLVYFVRLVLYFQMSRTAYGRNSDEFVTSSCFIYGRVEGVSCRLWTQRVWGPRRGRYEAALIGWPRRLRSPRPLTIHRSLKCQRTPTELKCLRARCSLVDVYLHNY